MKKIISAALVLACMTMGLPALADNAQDITISYERTHENNGEQVHITAASGDSVAWEYDSSTGHATELDMVNVFEITGDRHMVVVNNDETGMTALDAATGAELWNIPADTAEFGASNTFCQGDGVFYLVGYYGPDAPVAIDFDGNVLWEASVGSNDCYWPYEIELADDGIKVTYEAYYTETNGEGTYGGYIIYDMDGNFLSTQEYDGYSKVFNAINDFQPGTAGSSLKQVIAVAGVLNDLRLYYVDPGVAPQIVADHFAAMTPDEKAAFKEKYELIKPDIEDILANGTGAYLDLAEEAGAHFMTDEYSADSFNQFDAQVQAELAK